MDNTTLFEKYLNEYARGEDRLKDLKGLYDSFEKEMAEMDKKSKRKYIQSLTSYIGKIEKSENPAYWDFVTDFTNWTYTKIKEAADEPRDIKKCEL